MLQQLSPDDLDRFMKVDFAEMKDLCKHFLTLVAGVLVFSVTFSEKIVNFTDASTRARTFLFIAWGLFMAAIVLGGSALALIAISAGIAQYGNFFGRSGSPYDYEGWSVICVLIAGTTFVAGMLFLLLSGAVTVFRRTTGAEPAKPAS